MDAEGCGPDRKRQGGKVRRGSRIRDSRSRCVGTFLQPPLYFTGVRRPSCSDKDTDSSDFLVSDVVGVVVQQTCMSFPRVLPRHRMLSFQFLELCLPARLSNSVGVNHWSRNRMHLFPGGQQKRVSGCASPAVGSSRSRPTLTFGQSASAQRPRQASAGHRQLSLKDGRGQNIVGFFFLEGRS